MNVFHPLLAALDLGDVIKLIVFLLIIVLPVIGQLMAKIRQIPPPAGRPIPPRPADIDVADEIEAFMRRAAERNAGPGTRPVVAQPVPTAEPVRAEVVAEQRVAEQRVGGQVSEHVSTYLDSQEFGQRESLFGKEFVQGDQQIQQHRPQAFDHRVSNFEADSGEVAKPTTYQPPDLVGTADEVPDSFATGLLELITTPDSLRQAIILNEILHRPEERWA